jgi:hypothetical protein
MSSYCKTIRLILALTQAMTFIIIRDYWTRKYDQILAVHTCAHLKKGKMSK